MMACGRASYLICNVLGVQRASLSPSAQCGSWNNLSQKKVGWTQPNLYLVGYCPSALSLPSLITVLSQPYNPGFN